MGRRAGRRAMAHPAADEPPARRDRRRPRAVRRHVARAVRGGLGMSGGRLDGKVAIITGASTGLGPVMAAMFVREGARVLLTARREELVQEAAASAGDGRDRDARRRDERGRRRGDGRPRGRRVRARRHHVQQRRRTRDRSVDLGADARELERHHRHRRHRRDALHPRGAEPVDARTPFRGDPELLVDRRVQRHGPQVALRHRQGVAARVHQGRRARGRSSTASAATASCPAASTPSCGATGCSAWPTSRASTSRAIGRACSGASRCATSPRTEDVANLALFLASDESRTITGQSIPVDAGGYMQG